MEFLQLYWKTKLLNWPPYLLICSRPFTTLKYFQTQTLPKKTVPILFLVISSPSQYSSCWVMFCKIINLFNSEYLQCKQYGLQQEIFTADSLAILLIYGTNIFDFAIASNSFPPHFCTCINSLRSHSLLLSLLITIIAIYILSVPLSSNTSFYTSIDIHHKYSCTSIHMSPDKHRTSLSGCSVVSRTSKLEIMAADAFSFALNLRYVKSNN